MASLINDLIDFKADFVLILDDFHVIQSNPIQQAVTYLVEHMPHQMHLVISTRMDPRLPITRFRARNQVLELRMDQLRFAEVETEAYLNQTMGLELSKDKSGILQARTEGWIASLQMAALSLKSSSDSKKFIMDFSGSNRYIMDYLLEEVINQQSPSVQNFLLQTCILERLNKSLCNAVTQARSVFDELNGNDDTRSGSLPSKASGQEVLEHLERSNLFIIPLEEERQWYRYHHLFASLLRARLAHVADYPIHMLHLHAPNGMSEMDTLKNPFTMLWQPKILHAQPDWWKALHRGYGLRVSISG